MKTTRAPLVILGLLVGIAGFSPGTTPLSASLGRSGFLWAEKECSKYDYKAGDFCSITASNISEIPPTSKVFYTQPGNVPAGMLDSNVLLDAGDGSRAVGRCTVDSAGVGLCTFSDGTGSLAGFEARIDVTPPKSAGDDWHWRGTYRFNPRDTNRGKK